MYPLLLPRLGHQIKNGTRRLLTTHDTANPDFPQLTSVRIHTIKNSVDVFFNSKKYALDSSWLRDNCPSQYIENPRQKLYPLSVLPNVRVVSARVEDNHLLVTWPDGHESAYPSKWLLQQIHQSDQEIPSPNIELAVVWSGLTWSKYSSFPVRVQYQDLLEDADLAVRTKTLKNLLQNIYTYGFALVEQVPPTPEGTRSVAEAIAPLKKNIRGNDFWEHTVESDQISEEVKHDTMLYTKPYTDEVYLNNPSAVQVFHCLERHGTNGPNYLIDGWLIANEMSQHHADVYEYLNTHPLDFYYMDENHLFHSHVPVIQLNSNDAISAFWYSSYHRLPPHPIHADHRMYYKSIQILEQYLQDEKYRISIELAPGVVCVIFSWRVLVGSMPFTGYRKLTGCHIAFDDYMDRFRFMSRKSK
ncbi:trimethyllysine dioxygenase, mitochondrial-like [Schistocerca gregaria]|uniref:trimethyllysine dioxygenase, mitochondrial-like n=1 Tax=Schistocerca gregaria TaxID=7010 RepID=UPI00211E6EC7|nr:trimethyllysine dioxygenase, mitochondrial-like [Schistocerca gregaria]